jgi:hypothetical protein
VLRLCQIPFKSGLPSAVGDALYLEPWALAGVAANHRIQIVAIQEQIERLRMCISDSAAISHARIY